MTTILISVFIVSILSGCGAKLGEEEKKQQKAKQLYDTGVNAMAQERYQEGD